MKPEHFGGPGDPCECCSMELIKPGARLEEEYCRFALPIIKTRLAQAGVRLAWTLNQIFEH